MLSPSRVKIRTSTKGMSRRKSGHGGSKLGCEMVGGASPGGSPMNPREIGTRESRPVTGDASPAVEGFLLIRNR